MQHSSPRLDGQSWALLLALTVLWSISFIFIKVAARDIPVLTLVFVRVGFAALILHAIANQAVDAVLALLLIIGGVFGAQFGARAGRNLRADVFRLLLALLILGVGVRFAVELVVQPAEPFSLVISEMRE